MSEPQAWIATSAARLRCETCGEFVYARRRVSGGPIVFPKECESCGAAVRVGGDAEAET